MRRLRDDSGATAVEFALVVPVAITLIVVVLYAGLYYFYSATASHVARIVARDAALPTHGSYPTSADEQSVADHAAGTLLPAPNSVAVTPVTTPGEGNEVTVTVTYSLPVLSTVSHLLPFLSRQSGNLSRTVTVRYE